VVVCRWSRVVGDSENGFPRGASSVFLDGIWFVIGSLPRSQRTTGNRPETSSRCPRRIGKP
jgi:hypothetical protein